jgi:hypothetical protein
MEKLTTIYQVYDDNPQANGVSCFPTLKEALAHRKTCGPGMGAITKMDIAKMPIRELVCRLISNEGFALDQVELYPHNPEE